MILGGPPYRNAKLILIDFVTLLDALALIECVGALHGLKMKALHHAAISHSYPIVLVSGYELRWNNA
ncbi:MAG: hypothetical protein DHS20C12_02610 [Pseudohongiella sp.]|nr:MAG: hypothetical protein DHS20C12_02610 [Pseudohongiella sp.]